MMVGICKIELFLGQNHSLKEKRQVLNRLKERTFQKFRIPVSEVNHQELWQRSELGFSVVGAADDSARLSALMEKIVAYWETLGDFQVSHPEMEMVDF